MLRNWMNSLLLPRFLSDFQIFKTSNRSHGPICTPQTHDTI